MKINNRADLDPGLIHSDPHILAGKPVVRGTRLSVEFLRELVAAGWSEADLLSSYPQLPLKAISWIARSR
jgi:uncharacterized protein (DUF433 family)